jgi:superfamily I DNA/RNA helicase
MDSIAILLRASGLAAPIAKALIDHGIPYKLSGEESWREEEEPDSVLASVQTGGVRIMTIHAAKGLEFDHVFVPALEEGILPFTLYGKGDRKKEHIEEEQRLLYVAMTRAQSGLYLSWARKRLFQGRLFQSPPSRFLGRLDRLIPLSETRRRARKQEKPSPQLDLF